MAGEVPVVFGSRVRVLGDGVYALRGGELDEGPLEESSERRKRLRRLLDCDAGRHYVNPKHQQSARRTVVLRGCPGSVPDHPLAHRFFLPGETIPPPPLPPPPCAPPSAASALFAVSTLDQHKTAIERESEKEVAAVDDEATDAETDEDTEGQASGEPKEMKRWGEKRWERWEELEGVYRIEQQLGTGTFSTVYEATHLQSGKRVAIKRLLPTSSPRRTSAEMRALLLLQGKPHVTQLLDLRRAGDSVSLVLEIARFDKFQNFFLAAPVRLVACYMRSLLCGLEVLHALSLVHRDIKPSNFLFDPGALRGVLSDFGLTQTLEQARALPPSRCGTRGFRPPEVLLGSTQQSAAIDVWAAGLILLSFMTRRYPCLVAQTDALSLAELATVFGTQALTDLAASLGYVVAFNYSVPPTALKAYVLTMNPSAVRFSEGFFELLDRCLQLDPSNRITATDAILLLSSECGGVLDSI